MARLHSRVRFARTLLRRSDHGQALVLVALMLVVLIGFVALAVDAGYLMSQRRGVQAAADGAALAADKAYQRNENSDITQTALDYAAESGFPASDNDISVDLDPAEFMGDYDKCVRVEILHDVTEFFIGAIYTGDWQVGASAVACTYDITKPYALIALNEDGDGITTGGNSTTVINGGGAMSNADSTFQGNLIFDVGPDGPIDAVDGITIGGNASVTGEPNPTAGPITDPYAAVPQPCTDPTSLPTYDDPAIVRVKNNYPEDITFDPGYYPIGIDIKGRHNVTFNPGIYCFAGDFSGSSGSSNPQNYMGNDVLFFFFDPAEFDLQGQGVNVDFDGIQLHSDSNDYENIVVFYQREPICHDGEFRLLGNNVQIDGVFYAPCASIHLSGNSGSTITGQIIGGEIDLLGGSQLTINFQSDVEALAPQVYLVE